MKTNQFKILFVLIAISSLSFICRGQDVIDYPLRDRAVKNLSILVKDDLLAKRVIIDDNGITILDKGRQRKLYSIYWTEMGHFISNVENADYYEVQRLFAKKGTQAIQNIGARRIDVSYYKDYPTDMSQLRVVLDPGHFGGNHEEAKLEQRILRMTALNAGTKEDVTIFESELNYATALLIQQKLKALGCTDIIMTRGYGTGAVGKSFADWLQEDAVNSIKNSYRKEDISKERFDQLNSALKTVSTNGLSKKELFDYFRFLDFRSRIDKANEYHAHVTLSLHYNASEGSRPSNSDRYYPPVDDNYNMMFVPGGFLPNELDKTDAMLDFIRLLVSPDIDNSTSLSKTILDELEKTTKVGPADLHFSTPLAKVVNTTDHPGVYARNLPQLRMIRGTVIYGETLLQDNHKEAAALSNRTIRITDPETGKVLTASQRESDVAEGYVNGLIAFLQQNKEKSLLYTARIK